MSTPQAIPPHGGHLIDRIATDAERQEFLGQADRLVRIQLDDRAFSDLAMIAICGFSPLIGFMESKDYETVVSDMRLANGLPWSIPVTLSVSEETANSLKEGTWVRLDDKQGRFVAQDRAALSWASLYFRNWTTNCGGERADSSEYANQEGAASWLVTIRGHPARSGSRCGRGWFQGWSRHGRRRGSRGTLLDRREMIHPGAPSCSLWWE